MTGTGSDHPTRTGSDAARLNQHRETADEAERHRLNREYARRIIAEAGPMTDEQRRAIVALFRPVARRLRDNAGGGHAA